MTPRRRPGNAEIVDLFHRKDGSDSSVKRRILDAGRNLKDTKRWCVRWVDYEHKQRNKSFHRRVDAKDFLDEITAQLTRGEYVKPEHGKTTVGTVYTEWEPTSVHVSGKTRYDRQGSWRNHVRPKWKDRQLSTIRKADVQAWVAEMHDSGCGQSTIERAVEVLRLTLEHAVDSGRLRANPAKGIKIPRAERPERYYLTVKQSEAVATSMELYSALIRVFCYCGLRWGEATALRVQDVDLDRRRLNVVKAFTSVGGKRVEKDTKSHENRSVPYPAVLDEALKELVDGRRPDERVFTTPDGTPLNASNFRNRFFVPAKVKAGQVLGSEIPPVTIHDLRHTAASLAVSSGANVKAVQRMLGHKSAAMTLDTYADLFDDDLDEVAVKMDRLISEES